MLPMLVLFLLGFCLLGMIQQQAQIVSKPLDWFKPDERELARHTDPDEIRRRGEDMVAKGQLQPVGATEDGRLIFGHGRLLSAGAVGIKTLEVKIFPVDLTDTQFRLIRASENLQRKDLTVHQKWLLCTDLLCGNPGWKAKDLAAALHLDPSYVTRLVSPSRTTPAWQQALKEGKVGIGDAYEASQLPEKDQAELLRLKLAGASRDDLARFRRQKPKNGQAPAVKVVTVAKVKCELPTAIVTIAAQGNGITLSDIIKTLTDLLREVREAEKARLDAKTFAAALKCRKVKPATEAVQRADQPLSET